jgi:hypothetical protein
VINHNDFTLGVESQAVSPCFRFTLLSSLPIAAVLGWKPLLLFDSSSAEALA